MTEFAPPASGASAPSPRRRNPLAFIGAVVTALMVGVLFAGSANLIGYAGAGPPPDEATTRQVAGSALPGVPLAMTQIPTTALEVEGQPATVDRVLEHPSGLEPAFTRADWVNPPAGGLAQVVANLERDGWSVSSTGWQTITAVRSDLLVTVHDYDGALTLGLRHQPPEAVGAAVVFGLGGFALGWWAVAAARRRLDVGRTSGGLAVAAFTIGVLICMPVLGVTALATVGYLVRDDPDQPALWQLTGLPWIVPGYVIGLTPILLALALAMRSGRARMTIPLTLSASPALPAAFVVQGRDTVNM